MGTPGEIGPSSPESKGPMPCFEDVVAAVEAKRFAWSVDGDDARYLACVTADGWMRGWHKGATPAEALLNALNAHLVPAK